MAKPSDNSPKSPAVPSEGGAPRGVIEEFKCAGGSVYACSGGSAIPRDGGSELGAYSHVDVTLSVGVKIPQEFAVYFDGRKAKCLKLSIYTQLKQRLAPAKPKAS